MQLMRSYEGASSEETKLYLVMKERQAPTTRLMMSKDGRRRVYGEWTKVSKEEEERIVTDGGRQGRAQRLARETCGDRKGSELLHRVREGRIAHVSFGIRAKKTEKRANHKFLHPD